MAKWLSLGLLMLSSVALAGIDAYEFKDPAKEALYRELIFELRCPKCQNQNIADSNAPLAKDLRERVYQQINQGKNKGEIVDYMVDRYGNFVTYRPPLEGSTYVLWFAPVVVLLFGLAMVVVLTRKKVAKSPSTLSEEEQAKIKELLNSSEEQDS